MNTWTVIHLQVPGISHLHSYKYANNNYCDSSANGILHISTAKAIIILTFLWLNHRVWTWKKHVHHN